MQRTITRKDQQQNSILWAIGLALDDQEHYLKSGNPAVDYADEWPEVAATKGEQLNNLAEVCEQMGDGGMAATCRSLASEFRAAGLDTA